MRCCMGTLAFILVVIGALNWGLWGFFQFDLVAWLFGSNTVWTSRLVYGLVGLAGLWSLRFLGKIGYLTSCGCDSQCNCRKCNGDKSNGNSSKN